MHFLGVENQSETCIFQSLEMGDYSTQTIFQSMVKDSSICSYVVPKYKDRKRKRKEDLEDENRFYGHVLAWSG